MLSTQTLSPLLQAFMGDLHRELDHTRTMLERIPDEHFAWKPHEKSMPLGALGAHLANLPWWMMVTLRDDAFDTAGAQSGRSLPENTDALLRDFDEKRLALERVLEQTDEAYLAGPWSLMRGSQVVFTRPRSEVFRMFGINHMVHHRGQLSVYLRLLDVPLPPIYGPTADTQPGRSA
jgi:uncharacterized damage-inducible protein DinB